MPTYPEDSGSGSEYEDEGMRPPTRKRGRGGKTTVSKRPRHDTMESNLDVEATLFEIVRQGRMSMIAVVDDWIEAYKTDRNGSLLDLIQFFINSSGCKGTVTSQMLREATEGFQDVIKRMTEEFDEDSGDYPLIAAGTHFRKFRSNFCEFVQALVRQCQYQIIYDQYMMDNILTLLTELSNSQVRAFRHTATLAAMKLMTGLVNVALALSVSLDNTQRQYDAERNKAANKRASEKLDILLQKRKELEEQQSEIESMLNGIFKGIFVHRYRDYIADIRALCMEEIGTWMKMFPKVFLTDSYLKYVGWTLHDKQKEVRSKCLHTLLGLYGDTEMTRDLKLFTSRFKDRIVSMTLDKEYDVAVLAIKLLVLIQVNCTYDTPVLSSGDSESIYQLVFSCHRPVAIAAAEFLNKQLFADKEVNPGYTKRGRRRSPNAPLIADLVMFFIESELHEHATYLVDSLWEVAGPMLKDWECMSDMLLEEPANDQDALDEKQESALVDIMVCSVKQAAEGVPPSGRQGYSKKNANKDRKTAIEDKVRLTEHFIVALPNILRKFHVDKEKVAGLLQIPRYFDLEFYTTSRLEKHLEDLLSQMAIVVDKHTDSEVLEQASRTYNHLCDDEYAIYSKATVARRAVIDTWAENFRLAFDIFKLAGDEADDEEIYNVVQSLKRLTNMYMFNDMTSFDIYPRANLIISFHQERADSVPEPMLRQAVEFIYYDVVAGLLKVKERSDGGVGVGTDEPLVAIAELRKKVTEYLRACELLLTQSPHKKVQEACYMSICDLLVMFAAQLANSNPTLKPLVQKASDHMQHALIEFVKDFVFVPEEEDEEDDTATIDALHRRRSLLAAICKLFVFSMIDLRLAATVFQQYIRYYSDYGDIIKDTISRSRHVNKLACAQTLALSLMTLYRDTVREQGGELDHSSQEYGHMKELARRFALTFGLDQVKTRDAVAELHKEGILFALKKEEGAIIDESVAPQNLSFLGILVEFSAKLMKQDKKTVLQYLDRHTSGGMQTNQGQSWIPLVTYRNSLLQGAEDEMRTAHNKNRRGRRRKNEGDLDAPQTPRSPATPMQQPPMSPQTPMTPQNTMGHPQLSSTVVRGVQGVNDPHQKQVHIPDEHSLYQANSVKSWINTGKVSANKTRRLANRKGSARSTSVVSKQTEPRKPKASGKTQNVKTLVPERHYSVDEGFIGEVEKVQESLSGLSASLRSSVRKNSTSAPSYAEESEDDFDTSYIRTQQTKRESQVLPYLESKKSNGRIKAQNSPDSELKIDEFEDMPTVLKYVTSKLSFDNRMEVQQNGITEIKADDLLTEHYQSEGDDLLVDLVHSPEKAHSKDLRSSLSQANPFQCIIHEIKRGVRVFDNDTLDEGHITDVSSGSGESSEDQFESCSSSYNKTPEKKRHQVLRHTKPQEYINSKNTNPPVRLLEDFNFSEKRERKVALGLHESFDSLSNEKQSILSDKNNDIDLLAEKLMHEGGDYLDYCNLDDVYTPIEHTDSHKLQEKGQSESSGDDDDLGAFADVMQDFFLNASQRSQSQNEHSAQSSQKCESSQTMINTPMARGGHAPQVQDYQHSMHSAYPMSVPQQSPMSQLGTQQPSPMAPPPQYMHPGSSSNLYHQNPADPFHGVMSPIQQQSIPPQSPYFGS